ncbi:aerotaxis sensor receptor, flavoprotein [Salmonella enterica]|nr:aerotaxis sensor receptor, flavoprotein [Salmonella enterica]EBP9847203.1 aerotaxis sensor receptor, flavoprotein [Salmonella enterica]
MYITDELEWGEADPDDEDSFPDVTGPEWIINNVAHFGG